MRIQHSRGRKKRTGVLMLTVLTAKKGQPRAKHIIPYYDTCILDTEPIKGQIDRILP